MTLPPLTPTSTPQPVPQYRHGAFDHAMPDAAACMLGSAPDIDCDGIPDEYDPYPDDPPFATANPELLVLDWE